MYISVHGCNTDTHSALICNPKFTSSVPMGPMEPWCIRAQGNYQILHRELLIRCLLGRLTKAFRNRTVRPRWQWVCKRSTMERTPALCHTPSEDSCLSLILFHDLKCPKKQGLLKNQMVKQLKKSRTVIFKFYYVLLSLDFCKITRWDPPSHYFLRLGSRNLNLNKHPNCYPAFDPWPAHWESLRCKLNTGRVLLRAIQKTKSRKMQGLWVYLAGEMVKVLWNWEEGREI